MCSVKTNLTQLGETSIGNLNVVKVLIKLKL